jgi:hypothetical protein
MRGEDVVKHIRSQKMKWWGHLNRKQKKSRWRRDPSRTTRPALGSIRHPGRWILGLFPGAEVAGRIFGPKRDEVTGSGEDYMTRSFMLGTRHQISFG